MSAAFAEALSAERRGEAPLGAVVFADGVIVARAGNQTIGDNDPTAHAEIVALRRAALVLATPRLPQCDLYVTLEPCVMCAGALAHARIRRLYYGAEDSKGGAVDNGVRFFRSPSCQHRPEVYGGIRGAEAGELLRHFFVARRSTV